MLSSIPKFKRVVTVMTKNQKEMIKKAVRVEGMVTVF